jgi:hypothetical protein
MFSSVWAQSTFPDPHGPQTSAPEALCLPWPDPRSQWTHSWTNLQFCPELPFSFKLIYMHMCL